MRRALLRGGRCLLISPLGHLAVVALVERRPVDLRREYPAVTIGDTALALGAALSVRAAAGPGDVRRSRRRVRAVATAASVAFGAWQLRDEIRRGVYTRRVALGPSKLWHQFVIYPVLGWSVGEPLWDATASLGSPAARRGAVVGAWACVALWAALVAEAWRHPRQAHGPWPWMR